MKIQKEKKIEKENIEKNLNLDKLDNNIIIDFQRMKDIIDKLFIKNQNYNEIINHKLFLSKITNRINAFYKKFNHNYNCFNNKSKIAKNIIKLKRNINFYYKTLYNSDDKKVIKMVKLCNKKYICILINSFFVIKNYVNEANHLDLQKYIKLLFYFHYFDIISLIEVNLIIEFYINIFIDLIIKKSHYLSYIEDLIEAIINYPYSNKNNKANEIFDSIITLFQEYFLCNLYMKLKISKSPIWLKLLSNKIINKDNDKLSKFLVKIYRHNLTINFLFGNIYKQSALDLNYYSNSINFLSLLFKEEEITKKDYCNFYIKNGFYIPKNNPLILEKIKFKENEFSLIFSFKIIKNSMEKEKNEEEIIIFNLSNNNGNIILKFIINKDKSVNIIHGNKEWKIKELKISENKDYLVCITQSYSSFKSTKLFFFINNINNDFKEKNLANKNVIINVNSIKTKKDFIKYKSFEIQSPYPYFDSEMILELGKSNFNGIIGDFIIINKKINEADIFNLFNLNGYYSYFVENTNDKYNLISKFINFYTDNKDNLNYFKKLNFNCILKILSYKLNNKFIKDKRELKIENFGILKHKDNNIKIRTIDIKYSIDVFYNSYGIEFLLFQLHNISNLINNNNSDDLHLFNHYLYLTLKFFYEIMTTIDDDISDKKKNDSLKFSYFILSLMIILYKNKKKENNIKLDIRIYELLLKYIDFYTLLNYYNHRNLILSILLDDSFFNQKEILKKGEIIVHLMAMIKNNLNNDSDIINEDILYKILNLDFILESKEYHHKLYMKLILLLLLIKNNKMIYECIIKNIIHMKNEIKLYHYLKYIYINLEKLKENLQNDQIFISFIKTYSKTETNYFHCKYCFNLYFLIFQIKQVFKIEDSTKDKYHNMNIIIKNKEDRVKFKICLLKCKFINCFNMNNDIKFKFIKNNKCIFSSGNNNSFIKNNDDSNKDSIIHIELNLLQYIITSKIILTFDSIINDFYNIYFYNQRNIITPEDNELIKEREHLNIIFDSIIFFWKGLINYYKKGKYVTQDHIDFLIMLLNLKGTETFFRIYLMFDYKSAIIILHNVIEISINKLQNPFYYNFIEVDENIDRYDKINNLKIKKSIIEKIILEIDKIDINEEIINDNRTNLIIIINEITQNNIKISGDIEKYFYTYLKDLSEKNFFNNKILYQKKENEYYNILELTLNILFEISKQNNYNKKNNDFIYQFVIFENNKSIFYSIDQESLKENQTNNKKKGVDFSNILYCIYFLIFFIELKNKLLENNNTNFNKEIIDNQLVFINTIITVVFLNSKQIFKLINNKKSLKYYNTKTNNAELDIYYSLFNYYCSNSKKFFSFEELEKFYHEYKLSKLKAKSIDFRESKQRKKNNTLKNEDNSEENNSNEQIENFVLINYCENNQNHMISDIIIDNYISIDNKNLELENKKNNFLNNRFDSFNTKKDNNLFHNSINYFKGKVKEIKNIERTKSEYEIKKNNKNEINDENDENEYNNDKSSGDDSSELNNTIIDKSNLKIEEENKKEIDDELDNINISKIIKSNDTTINNQTNQNDVISDTNIINSKTKSIVEDDINNNSKILNINDIQNKKDFNIKKLLYKINIPVFYYKKLINYNHLYFTKMLINPKMNYIWKIFIYSFSDIIFNDTNFKKLSKAFRIFTKNYRLEMSSEEKKFHLNHPTKIKNFICKDYYRPFLKPDLKFFNRDLIHISHKYIPKNVLEKIKEENKLSQIKFFKFFPLDEKEKDLKKFYCENVSYKGSIFGKMYILDSFLIFVNKTYKNFKKNDKKVFFFLYSKEDINKYKKIQKVIIFYFNEIKEIILRRFCLKNIGYEIFLKDGRSYLFNFFNKNQMAQFSNLIISKNKDILINDPINYFDKKEYKSKYKKGEINNFQYLLLINKFSTRSYNDNGQYLIFPIIFMSIKDNISRDLSKAVCLNKEESEIDLTKYIANFNLMKYYFNNHYSTSAYILYYLVRLIPYTYLQIEFQSGKFDVPERIFSCYNNYNIALNTSSENRELIPEFFHNYEFCLNLNYNQIGKMQHSNLLVHNFNSNKYKNSVEFIINHRRNLDSLNIVPWINNIFGYNQINDSKEVMNLFPLYSYEQFNDFEKEYLKIREKLKGSENEYIGAYNEVRNKIGILDLGISPIQLFKSPHPERPLTANINNSMIDLNSSMKNNSRNLSGILNTSNNSINNSINNSNTDNNSSKIKNDQKSEKNNKETKINESFIPIKKFISKEKSQKYKISLNNQTMNIFFIFKREIVIYNISNFSKKLKENEPKIEYPVKLKLKNNLIEIDSFSFSKNICCELMPGFYCICGNDDKTLKLMNFNGKYNFSYLWFCILTAIEIYNCKVDTTNYYSHYNYKLYLGDEEGNLYILDSKFKYIFKNEEIKMIEIKITKKIKLHKDYINSILFNERLNIVISSCGNGEIGINNAFSLETLNVIHIGKNYLINNIKVSFYDLLYVNCYNYVNKNYYLKCYTLNGLNVTKLKTENKIINFFINDYINIFYENKICDKYSLYDFKEKKSSESYNNKNKAINLWENEIEIKEEYYSDDEKDNDEENNCDNDEPNKLVHCFYCNKIKKLINIYDNNEMSLEKL